MKTANTILKFIGQNLATNVYFLATCLIQLQPNTMNASAPTVLRLNAAGSSMQNQAAVYFDPNGTITYNPNNDAPSLGVDPGYLNIVTRFDSIDYQIKCLPLLTQSISIPVKVTTGTSNVYQLYAADIQNLPAGACIMLHDNLLNTDANLRTGNYTCTISDTESVVRFVVTISINVFPVSSSFMDPSCHASGNGYASVYVPAGTGPWNYYWKDSSNNIIQTTLAKNTADTLFGVNAGTYKVDVTSGGACTNGTATFYLHGTQTPVAAFTSIDTATFTTSVDLTNTSVNAGSYWWDFGDGNGSNDINPSHYYVSSGTFTISLFAIGSVCSDTSVSYKKITVIAGTTSISQNREENILISRDEKGYYVILAGKAQEAVISVSDMLGKKISADADVKNAAGEKTYVNTTGYENQVLIISVVSPAGLKAYKKVIN
ncbi:MAG TPA: PKD domain-containing protein [Bacteroidia bacterium]|jgi:PKD repeat protein|nr:PKD domain-containing protein [Bacteroidia bacterium]